MPTFVYMLRRWGILNICETIPSNDPRLLVPNSPSAGSSSWQPLQVNEVLGKKNTLTPSDGREPAKNRAYIQELLDWYEAGKIRPHVSARYPLEKVADALRDMGARKVTGKVVLVP